MSLLEVKNLYKSYDNNSNVLTDVSFDIDRGGLASVIGPSGAGKSTLLRCINRMVHVTDGQIIFAGEDRTQCKKRQLSRLRTDIGMVFQHYNLVPRLTVIENVLHGRLGYKTTMQGLLNRFTEAEKEKAFSLLDTLGIVEHAYKRCDQLSGGQQQRV